MKQFTAVLSGLPPWVGVLGMSAFVGATSAVLAVLLYRDIVNKPREPIPVRSVDVDG